MTKIIFLLTTVENREEEKQFLEAFRKFEYPIEILDLWEGKFCFPNTKESKRFP